MIINEIDSVKAFELLKLKKNSILIDVRTSFEWNNIGIPDLTQFNKQPFFIEWSPVIDKNFINIFKVELTKIFLDYNYLIFMCKSGSRSRMAAKIAINVGFKNIFNITDGFEGNNLTYNGWINNKLPWKYLNN